MFNFLFDLTYATCTTSVLASILIVLFFVIKYWYTDRKRISLPGPIGLPLVGYLPFAGANPHLKLSKLQKQYGDVFAFRLGWMQFVILGSYDVIKEALTKYDELLPRPHNFDMMPNLAKWPGVLMNYGKPWAEIRRFSMLVLKSFGIGTSSMELKIHDEINFMLRCVSETNGQAICMEDILRLSTTNTICTTLFGQRFDYNDETFTKMMKLAHKYTNELRIDQIKSILPTFLIKLFRLKDAGYYGTQLYNIFLKIVEQRARSGQLGTNDSFIDVWLEEQNKPNVDANNFNNQQLAKVVWDFFVASSDTTATTIHWCLLYLAHYQEVQTKIQKEIDEKIGRDRIPNMIDQKEMPFTEAVICEVSRIVSVIPLSVPRRASEDVKFRGYIIPKDATIISNLWSVNHDSSIYPNPEEFKPERFLNEENRIVKRDELIPFGIGKRQCLGELLARMNNFLYLTSVLQNFSIKPASNSCIDLEPIFGILVHPKPQQICMISR